MLSSSGSFKRFDTVDKESCKNSTQHQSSPKHATTPIWNLAQNESEIPPQPLRPAPAPAPPISSPQSTVNTSQPKIVTFSLQLNNECPSVSSREPSDIFRPCSILHSNSKHTSTAEIPALEAPPKARQVTNHHVVNNNSVPAAIPRPVVKKSPQQNGFSVEDNPNSFTSSVSEDKLLQRANNTNPFLENTSKTNSNTALFNHSMTNNLPETSIPANPFIEPKYESTVPTYRRDPHIPYNDAPSFTFRSRSFSQTEVPDKEPSTISLKNLANVFHNPVQSLPNPGNPFAHVARKIKGPHMLQKTISEDFLFRKFGYSGFGTGGSQQNINSPTTNGNSSPGGTTSWNFSRLLMQEDAPFGLWRRNSSQTSLNSGSMTSLDGGNLERAISCESVDSDYASIEYNNDFDQSTYTQITGYLCVGLHYDK